MLPFCWCCCWKMPLAMASRFIGIIMAILSSISVVRGCVTLLSLPHPSFYNNIGNSEAVLENARTMLLIQTSVAVIWATCSVLLVVGVSRQAPHLVTTFLVFSCLFLTILTLTTLYGFLDPSGIISEHEMAELRRAHGPDTARSIMFASLIILLAGVTFLWYLWAVVLSYRCQMTDDLQRQRQECRQIPMV